MRDEKTVLCCCCGRRIPTSNMFICEKCKKHPDYIGAQEVRDESNGAPVGCDAFNDQMRANWMKVTHMDRDIVTYESRTLAEFDNTGKQKHIINYQEMNDSEASALLYALLLRCVARGMFTNEHNVDKILYILDMSVVQNTIHPNPF